MQFVGDLANEENRLIARERELAALRRIRAYDFSTRVFTIEEVLERRRDDKRQASGGPETDDAHTAADPVAESLADAMLTSFIDGRWVDASEVGQGEGRESGEAFETHYRIVASLVPEMANYGALYRCVKKDADNLNQVSLFWSNFIGSHAVILILRFISGCGKPRLCHSRRPVIRDSTGSAPGARARCSPSPENRLHGLQRAPVQ